MTTIAAPGSWASPVSLELVSRGGVGLPEGWADGPDLYWLRSDPGQGGQTSLFRRRGGQVVEVTPHHNLRSRIHDYGGRPAGTKDGIVVHTDHDSGAVLVWEPDRPKAAGPRVVVDQPGLSFAGFAVLPQRRQAVALRQDQRDPDDVRDALVVLELDAPNPEGGRVLAQGADFYYAPQVSPAGDVVWMEWDHPDMPWDATAIKARHLDGGPTRHIAGDGRSAVVHPTWAADGSILFLDDRSGHWNFQRWRDGAVTALHHHRFDCCDPAWVLQPPPYAPLADGSIGCAWREDGWTKVGRLTPDGRLTELIGPLASAQLTPGDPTAVVRLGWPDRPGGLHTIDWDSGRIASLAASTNWSPPTGLVPATRDFSWESDLGPVHAWYYPPANPAFSPPPGEAPPVIVLCHGGPTSFAGPDLDLAKLFWTSRGLGLLEVNYGGSAGFGRAYRERLRGQWGVVDVQDCVAGAQQLASAGLADPGRLVVMGGSAGGFTALAALCQSHVFAAGVSRYGIGDLAALTRDSPKFESHYLDGLVAPWPAGRQIYHDRSPIHQLDRLDRPLLLLQGELDPVVPVSQAVELAAAVRRQGRSATLVVYPGEGHGFRRAETIRDQYARTLEFLGQVLGFSPAPDQP